jgi:hypothetical protein
MVLVLAIALGNALARGFQRRCAALERYWPVVLDSSTWRSRRPRNLALVAASFARCWPGALAIRSTLITHAVVDADPGAPCFERLSRATLVCGGLTHIFWTGDDQAGSRPAA